MYIYIICIYICVLTWWWGRIMMNYDRKWVEVDWNRFTVIQSPQKDLQNYQTRLRLDQNRAINTIGTAQSPVALHKKEVNKTSRPSVSCKRSSLSYRKWPPVPNMTMARLVKKSRTVCIPAPVFHCLQRVPKSSEMTPLDCFQGQPCQAGAPTT